jgi:hypothetical protein
MGSGSQHRHSKIHGIYGYSVYACTECGIAVSGGISCSRTCMSVHNRIKYVILDIM